MSRRTRRVPLVGVMALALAFAAAPVAADEGPADVVSPTSNGAANDTRIMEFQTIVCDDYEGVRGNPGTGGTDATGGNADRYGSLVQDTDRPIAVLTDLEDGCSFSAGFVDFEVSAGSDGVKLSTQVDAEAPIDVQDQGTSRTTTGALLGPSGVGTLNLRVSAVVPTGKRFGALQCYDDARNPDNLEIFSVLPIVERFTCVLFLVDTDTDPGDSTGDDGQTGDDDDHDEDSQTEQPAVPPVVVNPDTRVLGEQEVVVERNGQSVTASGPSNGDIRIEFGADEDAATDTAVTAACDVLVGDAEGLVRLAENVVVIDPTGFAAGDEIEVTTLVPAADVEQAADWSTIPTGDLQVGDAPGDANFTTAAQIGERLAQIRTNRGLPSDPGSDALWVERVLAGEATIGEARTAISAKAAYWSADAYGVCFAGEKSNVGSLAGLVPLEGTALFGPVLLTACTDETGAPCIDARTRDEDGNVVIEYRIPAEDPWMR